MVLAGVMAAACGGRSRAVPERTEQGSRLNVGATAATPEIHINPQDGGGVQLQIGAARAALPGDQRPMPQGE